MLIRGHYQTADQLRSAMCYAPAFGVRETSLGAEACLAEEIEARFERLIERELIFTKRQQRRRRFLTLAFGNDRDTAQVTAQSLNDQAALAIGAELDDDGGIFDASFHIC